VTLEEGFCRLRRKGLYEAVVGVRQIEGHEMRLALHAGNHHHRFAEVRLRFARSVAQRHEHLLAADLGGPHVVLHDRVAARVLVLGSQPLEDPLGRVPLLLRPLLVLFQNGVDHALPRSQLGPPDRLLPPVTGRQGILQHLADRLPRQPKLPGHRSPALALDKNRPPHSRIQFHRVHTSGVPQQTRPLKGGEPHPSPPRSTCCQ